MAKERLGHDPPPGDSSPTLGRTPSRGGRPALFRERCGIRTRGGASGRGSRYRQRGAWDWLRHVWDREPTPAPYTWQILPIVGALFLACNISVFLLVRNGGSLGAVWAAWGVYLVGHWLVHWHFTLKHFHLLPAGQYTAVMCSVGYWLATCAVFIGQSPLDPTRPARDCLPLWPSLMVVSGLTHFVTGLVFWGRLMGTGLLVLALACVVRWAGDFAPLVHGVTMSAILWWWAWEARRRFLTNTRKAPLSDGPGAS